VRGQRLSKEQRLSGAIRLPLAQPSPPSQAMGERASVAARLLRWFGQHGRNDLPWQQPRTPYRVWLSEVMLQQTQVATVIPYFLRFVEKFPSLPVLAAAAQDDVLALWSGLGYYTRARNLHRAAQVCIGQHGGDLPRDFDELAALPGIGRSTAGAILAQAHDQRHAILDGNVKRVLTRFHGLRGWPGSAAVEKQLWKFAELHMPRRRIADYTQAIMDLGATLCTRSRPQCATCPLAGDCVAHRDGLTAQLPDRKPKRTLPTRSTVMLMLRDNRGRLLLERRPPTGVWAQMWSLPEAQDIASARRNIARDHGVHDIEFRQLPSFIHTFSHYRLDVTPIAFDIVAPACVADDSGRRWLHPSDAATLGLPAPVRKLIAEFAGSI
jgi:A/G-specific adenine glycosylase